MTFTKLTAEQDRLSKIKRDEFIKSILGGAIIVFVAVAMMAA